MILSNSDQVDACFEQDTRLRQYVMAATVITPKLILLLDIIQLKYPKSKISEVILQNRRKCTNYIHKCITNVTQLNQTALRLATNLYYLYDDVIVLSSINEKIKIWKLIYQIAERQVLGHAPLKLTVSDIPFAENDYCDLSISSIEKELIDYSDEIEAWIDLYLDDYDDSEEQEIYTEIISIMTDLRFLAHVLNAEG